MSEIRFFCQACGKIYGFSASDADDQASFCSSRCQRPRLEVLFGMQADLNAVHVESSVQDQTAAGKDDLRRSAVCKGLKLAETENIPVRPVAIPDAPSQETTPVFVDVGVCRICRNIDRQEPDGEAVHGDSTYNSKPFGNPANGQPEGVSMRLTKVDGKRVSPSLIEQAGGIYERLDSRGWTGSWTWRGWNYNRVPPALEVAVYEKFKQRWSKSKLAREFRLNRRTVIRICRDRDAVVREE